MSAELSDADTSVCAASIGADITDESSAVDTDDGESHDTYADAAERADDATDENREGG
jgi:hypothetical protein